MAYPAVIYELEETDPDCGTHGKAWDLGARVRVDAIDLEQQFYFFDREDAMQFMYIHGMQPVSHDAMVSMRERC